MARVTELDDDLTVYATKPWTATSQVVTATEPEDGALPREAEGMAYLLEVFLIKDVLQAWSSHGSSAVPSPKQAAAAVIHYATYDAYPHPDGS
jgi:hypothetical protein